MNAKRLTSSLRHDLKNHLSVLRLYTELLSRYLGETLKEDEKTKEYIETILRRSVDIEHDLKKLTPELLGLLPEPVTYNQNPESTPEVS